MSKERDPRFGILKWIETYHAKLGDSEGSVCLCFISILLQFWKFPCLSGPHLHLSIVKHSFVWKRLQHSDLPPSAVFKVFNLAPSSSPAMGQDVAAVAAPDRAEVEKAEAGEAKAGNSNVKERHTEDTETIPKRDVSLD